jgi:hypothetical protein
VVLDQFSDDELAVIERFIAAMADSVHEHGRSSTATLHELGFGQAGAFAERGLRRGSSAPVLAR